MREVSEYVQQMYKYADYLNRKVEAGEVTRDSLGTSIDLQLQTVMLIQIIGEAARRIRDRGEDLGHGIDLRAIAGMRNFVSHNYDGVDWNLVEEVVFEDIPALLGQLNEVMAERGIDIIRL